MSGISDMSDKFDFCINGGGMVGAALALGLTQQGYSVAIIETAMPKAFEPQQKPDLRLSAISLTSVDLLRALGAWPFIESSRVKPYDKLSVWEQPSMATEFEAQSIGQSHLGYFVENRLIQLGCHQALADYDIAWINQAKLTGYAVRDGITHVTLDNGDTLSCHYLIGADGARSQVRGLAQIGTTGWQYGQQAMGVTVEMHDDPGTETWQQFYPSGPRAFLPMYGRFASLIWYDDAARIKQLQAMNAKELTQEIHDYFPERLGEFTLLDKASFVLTRSHASDYVRPGVILIGDAAHTINPLAGQGVNLGFKDVATLLAVTAAWKPDSEAFYLRLKKDYETPRKRDNLMMMSAMDSFYLLFSNEIPPVKWVRNLMLKGADMAGPVKHKVLKYAMGMDEWKF